MKTVSACLVAASLGMTSTSFAHDRIAVYQNGQWSIDANDDHAWEPGSDTRLTFGGSPGDLPRRFFDGNELMPVVSIFNAGTWSVDLNNNGIWDPGDQSSASGGLIVPPGDVQFAFGSAGDTPLPSSSLGGLGVYNSGFWSFDANNNHVWDGVSGGDLQFAFGGAPGDLPVVGDWAKTGNDCVGIYNHGVWSLDWNCNKQWDGVAGGDREFTFGGSPGDKPIVADWSGTGRTCVGIFNGGTWSVDFNCDEVWSGPGRLDAQWSFGSANDTPVILVTIPAERPPR